MPLPFFYTDPISPLDTIVILNEDNSKHIVQVLRMQVGKQIKLTDGFGNIYLAEITEANKKNCTVKVLEKTFVEKSSHKVCIAISLIKNNSRLEWFLEKATEMGVSEIVLLKCDRTEKQHIKIDRLKGILVSAMLQSQQAWLPILEEPKRYANFVKDVNTKNKFIAHCEEQNKQFFKVALSTLQPLNSSTILIGPEGDFTLQEIELALQQNYVAVSLGHTRLRTETAALVAATLLCVE